MIDEASSLAAVPQRALRRTNGHVNRPFANPPARRTSADRRYLRLPEHFNSRASDCP